MKLGTLNIDGLHIGATEVKKVYLGSETVYESTPPGPPANGVYILYSDGSVSAYNSLTAGKTPVGPLLITDSVSIVINPTMGYLNWSSDTSTTISGVTTTTDSATALLDTNGASNTAAIISSGLQGDAFDFVTAKGDGWYLPAFGELQEIKLNEDNINVALELMSCEPLYFSAYYFWSSTQYSAEYSWCLQYDEYLQNNYLDKTAQSTVIAVRHYSIESSEN